MIRFNGMELIVHRPRVVMRTWKERLFSRPWQPLRRTKIAQPPLFGLDDSYIIMGGQIHCTQKGYDSLMTSIHEQNSTAVPSYFDEPRVPSPPLAPRARTTGYPFTSNGNGWAQRNGG